MRIIRPRLAFPAAFLFSAFLLAASPQPQAAADADCGAYGGNLCWENQSCVSIIFFKMCTTKYKYYPEGSGGGGGGGLIEP